MIPALVPLALFANGIAAGVMLGNAIGPAALAVELPYERYVTLIKSMWHRYDPFVPIMNGLALLCDIALAVVVHAERGGTAQPGLFGVSAVMLAALMTISVTKNVPINKFVTALDPANPPANWPDCDPRERWNRWNQLRVALCMGALVVNLAAVTVLL
jgi:uncharacterized membrane protein